MMPIRNPLWTRRSWLWNHGVAIVAIGRMSRRNVAVARQRRTADRDARQRVDQAEVRAARLDPGPWQRLAQQAVDAARTAGASYADAKLTRTVIHSYGFGVGDDFDMWLTLRDDDETVGVGVRVLVNGYWGFSASAVILPDEAVRLARDAVAQAQESAKGSPWQVDLGPHRSVTGTWSTPIRIDPFQIPIDEKEASIFYWNMSAGEAGLDIDTVRSEIHFVRQERVIATTDGTLVTQTLYESGGKIFVGILDKMTGRPIYTSVHGIDVAGAGWERFLDAKIPDQMPQLRHELEEQIALNHTARPSTIGRYTFVCDGAAMAALTASTLGIATQLDRALGYEANAGGTSFLDDPLGMAGHTQVTSPLVTLSANRSVAGDLATVKWDDEGIEPEPFTLIKDGVLTDFQTTREQAAWLAPYYAKQERPVLSHGCAGSEDALKITMQMMPNLSMEPSATPTRVDDLVADIQDGIFVKGAFVESDFQARTGLLVPMSMRQIKNGRLGVQLNAGAIQFNTQDIWKQVKAVGGSSTHMTFHQSNHDGDFGVYYLGLEDPNLAKGQPLQSTSYSVHAPAATIANQPLINPSRKG